MQKVLGTLFVHKNNMLRSLFGWSCWHWLGLKMLHISWVVSPSREMNSLCIFRTLLTDNPNATAVCSMTRDPFKLILADRSFSKICLTISTIYLDYEVSLTPLLGFLETLCSCTFEELHCPLDEVVVLPITKIKKHAIWIRKYSRASYMGIAY